MVVESQGEQENEARRRGAEGRDNGDGQELPKGNPANVDRDHRGCLLSLHELTSHVHGPFQGGTRLEFCFTDEATKAQRTVLLGGLGRVICSCGKGKARMDSF